MVGPAGMFEDTSATHEQAGENGIETPPRLRNDENSEALARRLELSSVAMEKLQLSSQSFGTIRPSDDISLPETDLITLDKSRKSFGLIKVSEGGHEVARNTIPPGQVLTVHPVTPEQILKAAKSHAEQFLQMIAELSPEDRLKLILEPSGTSQQEENQNDEQEAARASINMLIDRAKVFFMNLEPQYRELIEIYGDAKKMVAETRLPTPEKIEYLEEFKRWTKDAEVNLSMIQDIGREITSLFMMNDRPKNFNIGSPTNPVLHRRLSYGDNCNEPRLPLPSMPGQRVLRASACLSPSGSGRPTRVVHNDQSWTHDPPMPKAPPRHLRSNVHTISDLPPPPSQQTGQCNCCNNASVKSGKILLMTQQSSMADTTRRPNIRKEPDDNDPSDDNSSSDSEPKGKWNRRNRNDLDDDDDPDDNEGHNDKGRKIRGKKSEDDKDDWKFDSRLLKPPKAYDGTDLAYFQPWLEMLKSEMTSRWETWEDILEVLESAGERRLDPNPTENTDILNKAKDNKTLNQVRNELFRILKGMTSGEAQSAIVQGTTRNVLDVFRRLISKGKSRTKAVFRELRQMINAPRQAKNIADYDIAVAEWDANIAKLIACRGQDTLPQQEDLLDSYYRIFPKEVKTFAQLKIDESFEPDGFREEMEKYIYRQIRETSTSTFPLANIMKEVQEKFMNQEAGDKKEDGQQDEEAEPVQLLINLLKGKGKKGKGKGKGPNGGKGLCFNCGEAGHFASNCPKPKKDGNDKGPGKGAGKKGKGVNNLADILKTVGLQIPGTSDDKPAGSNLNMIRPMCCITRQSAEQLRLRSTDNGTKAAPSAIPPGSASGSRPSAKSSPDVLAADRSRFDPKPSASPSPPGSDWPTAKVKGWCVSADTGEGSLAAPQCSIPPGSSGEFACEDSQSPWRDEFPAFTQN